MTFFSYFISTVFLATNTFLFTFSDDVSCETNVVFRESNASAKRRRRIQTRRCDQNLGNSQSCGLRVEGQIRGQVQDVSQMWANFQGTQINRGITVNPPLITYLFISLFLDGFQHGHRSLRPTFEGAQRR